MSASNSTIWMNKYLNVSTIASKINIVIVIKTYIVAFESIWKNKDEGQDGEKSTLTTNKRY
jgi:hypothetical protein